VFVIGVILISGIGYGFSLHISRSEAEVGATALGYLGGLLLVPVVVERVASELAGAILGLVLVGLFLVIASLLASSRDRRRG
jgi:hypothetical protein